MHPFAVLGVTRAALRTHTRKDGMESSILHTALPWSDAAESPVRKLLVASPGDRQQSYNRQDTIVLQLPALGLAGNLGSDRTVLVLSDYYCRSLQIQADWQVCQHCDRYVDGHHSNFSWCAISERQSWS